MHASPPGQILSSKIGTNLCADPKRWCDIFTVVFSMTFWLEVLVALVAFLLASTWFRTRKQARAELSRLAALEREFPPRGFDASKIASRMERVRRDFAASAHARWRPVHHRLELLVMARRLVTGLAFFHQRCRETDRRQHDS